MSKLCATHGNPNMLFCKTCNEPICEKCTITGPHNT